MRWMTLLCLLALSGCFNRVRPVTLPDGSAGYTVTRCRALANCLAHAQAACGGPYDIRTQSESFNSGFTILVGCRPH